MAEPSSKTGIGGVGGGGAGGSGVGGGLQKAFYCDLCSKGYSRIHEYDAHLSSYDHSHKKRLADMKAMQKDPSLAEKRRERERKMELGGLGGMVKIKPIKMDIGAGTSTGTGTGKGSDRTGTEGFRKGGFKSAFGSVVVEADDKEKDKEKVVIGGSGFKKVFAAAENVETGAGGNVQGSSKGIARFEGGAGAGGAYESDTEDEGYERYNPEFPTP